MVMIIATENGDPYIGVEVPGIPTFYQRPHFLHKLFIFKPFLDTRAFSDPYYLILSFILNFHHSLRLRNIFIE